MNDYNIKDINLADIGKTKVNRAKEEMPGLVNLLKEYSSEQPLKGAKITGSLHMTEQTAVLIECLSGLGADIRWASCNIYSTQDHAAAHIAKKGVPVFAIKGMPEEEYWESTFSALDFNGCGPDLIVDDGGDATLMVHKGYEIEEDPSLLEVEPKSNEEKFLLNILKREYDKNPERWHNVVKNLKGISEETTTGVNRLYLMEKQGKLLVPCISVNDSVTKSKFDNFYGCRHSLIDGIKRATDVLLLGKEAVVCGYGDVGKGSSAALRAENMIVGITEVDPICGLQAVMEGYKVKTIEDFLPTTDFYVSATGNISIITVEHMEKMKNNAIVCNIGHFDNEIQVNKLKSYSGIERENLNYLVDRYKFPDGHSIILLADGRLVNLGCATGHPSLVMSCSFSNQVLAQIDLWKNHNDYLNKVYTLSKELDEKVARVHLNHFGSKLTKLTEEQSKYIGVPIEGPYKGDKYRY